MSPWRVGHRAGAAVSRAPRVALEQAYLTVCNLARTVAGENWTESPIDTIREFSADGWSAYLKYQCPATENATPPRSKLANAFGHRRYPASALTANLGTLANVNSAPPNA